MSRTRINCSTGDQGWLARAGLGSVKEVLAYEPEVAAALSRSSETFAIEIDEADAPAGVFVKRYWHRSKTRRLKQMFRGTLFGTHRARQEFDLLNQMRERGVQTPRPVAWGERRKRGFVRACLLITEAEAATESLDQFAMRFTTQRVDIVRKHAVITGLARAVRGMHDAGVFHGALAWRNILIRMQPDGEPRFSFLDPDTHCRLFDGVVPPARAAADLAGLMASAVALDARVGPSRFMRAYLKVDRLNTEQRALLREIIHKAADIAAYERHRIQVAETIRTLRDHLKNRRQGRSRFRSIDDFFAGLTDSHNAEVKPEASGKIVRFVLHTKGSPEPVARSFQLSGESLVPLHDGAHTPDLTVESDAECWLMVVNSDPRALRRLRNGGIRTHGDTALLATLAQRMSAPVSCPPTRSAQ